MDTSEKVMIGLFSAFIFGMFIAGFVTKKDMENKAIKAGVAKRIVANPNDWTTTFVFITNNVTSN